MPLIDDVAEPEIDEPVRRDEEVERAASKALADIELDERAGLAGQLRGAEPRRKGAQPVASRG